MVATFTHFKNFLHIFLLDSSRIREALILLMRNFYFSAMTFTTNPCNLTQILGIFCPFLAHVMYLWGCKHFNHKYTAFWRQLITSPLWEEIIRIPPFSLLLVSVVWEFVFSICPWSECRQQKNGVEQTADAGDGARPGLRWIQQRGDVLGCPGSSRDGGSVLDPAELVDLCWLQQSFGLCWIQQRGILPTLLHWHRCVKRHRDLPAPAGTRAHTHIAAAFHRGIAACPWGWGRPGNFQLKIQWIGYS